MKSDEKDNIEYNTFHIILIIVFHLFSIIFIALLKSTTYFQPESLIYPCCCILLASTIWMFSSWSFITHKLFHPYTIFLLSAILFNGGQAILEVFHLNKDGLLRGGFSASTLSNALFFVIFGLSAFHLGGLLSLLAFNISSFVSKKKEARLTWKKSKRKREYFQKNRNIQRGIYSNHAINIDSLNNKTQGTTLVGWGLFSISFLPAIYQAFQSISIVLKSGYQGLYQGEQSTSFSAAPSVLSAFIVPATMFLLTGSKKEENLFKKWPKYISVTLITLYIISRFLLGERRNVSTLLLAFSWLWHTWVKKISPIVIIGSGLILAIVFPIIAAVRNVTGNQRFSVEMLLNQFTGDNNLILATIQEMGGSMMTVAYSIDLVPSTRPFQLGADYWYAFLTLIPNLFWSIHPTIARGLSSTWLVWAVDPSFAMAGGGLGFSFLAEAYTNFGWVGGPISLCLIGFLFCSLTLWCVNSNSPNRIAFIASFTAFFPFYARSESALFIRVLIWYCFFPYICAVYFSRKHQKLKRVKTGTS
jgi:oligosaccharide repeat unit polymerase